MFDRFHRRPGAVAATADNILGEIDREMAAGRGIAPVLAMLDGRRAELQRYFQDRLGSGLFAKALTLKVMNLCVARFHFLSRSSTLLSRPYGLEVDPINNCNLACPGCVHSSHVKELELFQWSSGMLSRERYEALLRRYGPCAIQMTLCNYGEPLLNPLTPEFIRLAKNYLLFTTLSTNMTAKRFDADAYANSGLDYMTVSLDGATQGVYEKFRKKGDLGLALRNIQALVEAKRKAGKRRPLISWQFLAFEHNAHEIDDAMRMGREMGIDQFVVATPFDVSWDDPAIRPAAVAPAAHVFCRDFEQTLAENWNPFSGEEAAPAIEREFETTWMEQLAGQPEDMRLEIDRDHAQSKHVCHWLYKNMVMDATGRIIPCCAAPQPKADLVFANFDGGDGAESFNSEKYRLARLSFADKPAYALERAASGLERDPHCFSCDWYSDQEAAQIDAGQVQSYLRAAGRGMFDGGSIEFLSKWAD
jgi:MoaA/NifB/PqqE/SkfB family radical SAM enzyme